jgi:hypothetical protein
MKEVSWLFEADPLDVDETQRMRAAVSDLGLKHKEINRIQLFSGLGDPYPDTEDSCVFFFGSLQIARKILRDKKWNPGVFLTLENYLCQAYYPHMEPFLFNTPYSLLPLDEMLATRHALDRQFGGHGCIFVRPDSGFKTFTGEVFEVETIQADFHGLQDFSYLPGSTLVLVSSPKNIKREYRMFVVDDRVVAGSAYRRNRKLAMDPKVPEEVYAFTRTVLAETTYRPDPAWVIDICEDDGGKLWVLEIGSISCCGIYSANAKSIVKALTELLRDGPSKKK